MKDRYIAMRIGVITPGLSHIYLNRYRSAFVLLLPFTIAFTALIIGLFLNGLNNTERISLVISALTAWADLSVISTIDTEYVCNEMNICNDEPCRMGIRNFRKVLCITVCAPVVFVVFVHLFTSMNTASVPFNACIITAWIAFLIIG